MRELVLYNARLVDADTDAPGAVVVRDGRIARIETTDTTDPADRVENCFTGSCGSCLESIDCHGLALMPAFIDLHAHFRYPGQSEKETLESGLRAATAGGYGAVVLMPNTSPPVSDAVTARRIQEEAAAFGLAEVFQAVSLTEGQAGESIAHLGDLRGVLVASEDGRDVADPSLLLEAFRLCNKAGVLAACHCEDAALSLAARKYGSLALSLLAEDAATERNIALAEAAGGETRLHICHVSTKRSLDAVMRGKERGLCRISCEATPHHLALCAETGGPPRLVNPPLRSEADRQALIAGIASGAIDAIATDHAPHTAADKAAGAPGFPGLETAFALCNTVLVEKGVIPLSRLSGLMSAAPARILGLDRERGKLREGFLADLVLADPSEEWTVDASRFFTKGKGSPFHGMTLTGKVRGVVRGGCA